MALSVRQVVIAASFLLTASAATLPAHAQMDIKPTHPNGEVTLVVDFDVKPGFEAEFESFFKKSTKCSRLEPGNIAFDIHKVVNAERRYVLYEVWRSTDALKSHFERPYTKALFAMFDRALTKPVTAGGLRFIGDLAPAQRVAAVTGDPTTDPDCR